MQEREIELGGERVRLFEAGRPEAPTLLYLHGAGGLAWYPLLERLSGTMHVLAPEHPGFGRSRDLPDWLGSIGDLAYFYLDFLAALKLDRVHLVGHSMGGWTACEIAVRSTARLASVTLMAPAGVPPLDDRPYGDIFLWSPEEHARNSYAEPALIEARLAELATADFDRFLQNRAAAARLGWSPRLTNPQLPHWLHRIDRPCLVIWGEEDRICPFNLHRTFLERIPGARLEALPRSGHALHTERPAEVAARIERFVAAAQR